MIHNCDRNCDTNDEGIFDFVSDEYERVMIETAYMAVHELGLMVWIGSVDPEDGSFLLFAHPNMKLIYTRIATVYDEHSGSSFVLTMRNIQFIARNGLEAYKVATLANE